MPDQHVRLGWTECEKYSLSAGGDRSWDAQSFHTITNLLAKEFSEILIFENCEYLKIGFDVFFFR